MKKIDIEVIVSWKTEQKLSYHNWAKEYRRHMLKFIVVLVSQLKMVIDGAL